MILQSNGTEVVGCPVYEQPWCGYTPVMTIAQFFLGYFLTSIGYPIGITVIQTLFSKILGPRPQVIILQKLTVYCFFVFFCFFSHHLKTLSMCEKIFQTS